MTGRQVPTTVDALRLIAVSREISATAARFISARTVTDQKSALAAIDEKRLAVAAVLERMKRTSGDSKTLSHFVTLTQRLEANLSALEEAITQRTALRSKIDSLLEATHRVHGRDHRAASQPSPTAAQALEIAARTHLLVSLISEGSIVKEPAAFKPIQDRLKAAIESLHQGTAMLPNGALKRRPISLHAMGSAATVFSPSGPASCSPPRGWTPRSTRTSRSCATSTLPCRRWSEKPKSGWKAARRRSPRTSTAPARCC